MTEKLADEGSPPKRQHCWERLEYWEESWRFEETCCHSNSSEKPSANSDVKNSKRIIIIIIIIISQCNKLAQKEYKARHDWVGKVIHWEMCRKFQFDHTNKWYMHNPAPVLENATHKLIWDFNIQTDHLIPARRLDLIIINKKKRICKIVDFAIPEDHRINLKESEKKDKYLDLARELKKLWNMKVTIVPIVIGALGTITKRLLKGLEDLEFGGQVETIQTASNAKNGQNPETSPGDLRRLAVTQNPVKNHQFMLMWKTLKELDNNNNNNNNN